MQAIQTRVIQGVKRRRRVRAWTASGLSVTVFYDDSKSDADNHRAAARDLCEKLEWTGELVSGSLSDGSYAHVFTGRAP